MIRGMKKNPRKDFTQTALSIVEQATGAMPKPVKTPKQEASSKGGKAGGAARAKSLTPAKKKAIAKKAAKARWKP